MLDDGAPENGKTFRSLLAEWREAGSAGTEDVLGAALPLIAAAYAMFTIDSACQHWRGRGGLWKGRVQAIPAR